MPLVITGSGIVRAAVTAIVLVLVVVLAWLAITAVIPDDPFAGVVDDSRIQAVVLSNDSVFFGRLRVASAEFFELRDAHFLQQSVEGETVDRAAVPLTEQVHGPEDRMLIRRDEVIAIENLSPESDIAQQIEDN